MDDAYVEVDAKSRHDIPIQGTDVGAEPRHDISLLKKLILHLNQGMLAPPLLGQILIREDQGLHKQYTLWQM